MKARQEESQSIEGVSERDKGGRDDEEGTLVLFPINRGIE